MRFYPQSFELSTLGGWIATRAGGHFATGPTHVDDLVESVRALTAGGEVWESRRLPASGAGPSPDRMLLGSEGTLAVITEAWVRVLPRPERRRSASVSFRRLRGRARRGARARAGGPAAGELPPARAGGGEADDGGRRHARAAGARLRGGRRAGRPRLRALPRPRRRGLRGPRRRLGRVARGVPARALPARQLRGDGRALGDVRDRDHLGAAAGVRRAGQGRRRGGARRGHGDLPPHARLSRRRGALLHRARARAPRRGGRALGRASRPPRRRRSSPRAARSRTTTRSAATTARTTTASGPSRSPTALRAAKAALDPRALLNPGVLFDPR